MRYKYAFVVALCGILFTACGGSNTIDDNDYDTTIPVESKTSDSFETEDAIPEAKAGETITSDTKEAPKSETYLKAEAIVSEYKSDYEDYVKKACDFITTKEANDNMDKAYDVADECMQKLLDYIMNIVDETSYEKIVKEQLTWENNRNTSAEQIRDEYNGNPIGVVEYSTVMAEMTMERCEELLSYLATVE
ncbi:MAG: DUF1311 domain-containing protein [Pseudobutyrivibrio sp.]|nr:DUF1311 domain-containing protein [Pseudobutyrivibrio sp.]